MSKKATIPIRQIGKEFESGIVVGQLPKDIAQQFDVAMEIPHRHDSHFFAVHQEGNIEMEVDFERYNLVSPSLVYINPNQVHRVIKLDNNVTGYILALNTDEINSEYLKLLESITPVKPLLLGEKNFADIIQAMLLCINFFERKKDTLYHSLLKDSCNALIALMISQYLDQLTPADKNSRYNIITQAFKAKLEGDFISSKRPAHYANELNISVSYLNECVRNASGLTVSHHIQHRIILEAKRLLYHTEKSVKEIASELGYDDYPYFSRLFTKVTGITALAFRSKNRD